MARCDRRSSSLFALICVVGTAHADEPTPAPAEDAVDPEAKPIHRLRASSHLPSQLMATVRGSVIDNNTKAGLPPATIQIKGAAGILTIRLCYRRSRMIGANRSELLAWRRLRRMSAAESLRIGVALWTSDLARIARPPISRRPPSLAFALRIAPARGRIVR